MFNLFPPVLAPPALVGTAGPVVRQPMQRPAGPAGPTDQL